MEPQRKKAQTRTTWIITPGYTTVQFSVRRLFFFTIEGQFTDLAGTMALDEADLRRSSVEATIKAASITTGNKRRDAHLRSADFLDTENYPDIRFQSASVERGQDRDTLRIAGPLTIKGTSQTVALDVTMFDRSRSPQGEEVIYYTALTKIDRFDFGINYGRGLIGSIVKIMIQLQALRQN
jgi:polyisoprenoid-binding protein YceI